ncbi:methylated-DNA--[protein]-cysteine S-methyltransferase [Rouxiella sp. T17]|uniref:methylated-DNA--[protein]-cysteine S-methyltransferase n=1 Tax=Rouxiella sp. T17 TaxID=3085684 RepID=UPI002FC7A0EC
MENSYKRIASPVGVLTLVARGSKLAAVLWESERENRVRLGALVEDEHHPMLLKTEQQLNEYFAGTRTRFELALDFQGTDFQQRVWQALLAIPFGETRSYTQIAQAVGSPKSVRAVGAANGRNPLSIIAPCHRVIGASGALTGFAGGLEAKTFLLTLEGHTFSTPVLDADKHQGSFSF